MVVPPAPAADSVAEGSPGAGDATWASLFRRYKVERLQVRSQFHEAIVAQDFRRLGILRAAWVGELDVPTSGEDLAVGARVLVWGPASKEEGKNINSGTGVVKGHVKGTGLVEVQIDGEESKTVSLERANLSQAPGWVTTAASRLAAGRNLVTGVHRRFGYRRVIIACEPWCTGSAEWKAQMGVTNLPGGEAQPFYHCLVDSRDRPGGQVTLVAEENMEPSDAAYPVQAPLVDVLFNPCDTLAGYLPSPLLQMALARQLADGQFTL